MLPDIAFIIVLGVVVGGIGGCTRQLVRFAVPESFRYFFYTDIRGFSSRFGSRLEGYKDEDQS